MDSRILKRYLSLLKKPKFIDFHFLSSLMVSYEFKVTFKKIFTRPITRLYQYWIVYTSPLASSAQLPRLVFHK